MNEKIKTVWPEWEIVRLIGKGSFGEVYEAVRSDHQVESKAAIKVIHIPQADSELDTLRMEGMSDQESKTVLEGQVTDFVNEIQLMETFKGTQNIVSVEDYKVIEKSEGIGWEIYIRMELLTPLAKFVSDKNLSTDEVVKMGTDLCSALEICAQKGVIHRDIKPENIFVNSFGDYKLGDFGIARSMENFSGSLSMKGTYNYMAPEVERSKEYDATVDIYSLGLVLYFFLNKKRLPFLDPGKQILTPQERSEALRKRLDGELLPPPCEAPSMLASVILTACHPDPKKRFSNPTAFKNALINTLVDSDKAQLIRENELSQRTKTATSKPQAKTSSSEKKSDKKKHGKAVVLCGLAVMTGFAVFFGVRYQDQITGKLP
ncbi:MAG: serine/threonine protein kinase, partial [Lachnospiraceae bacterium]|nr:serine/threonine protein kinase [Lachnospiraceae bacterium]